MSPRAGPALFPTDVSGPATLGTWLDASATARPDAVAIETEERTVSYGELSEIADAFARGLWLRGVRAGDVVASLSENRPEHVALFFACARAGFIFCPLNWRLAPPETAEQIALVTPRVLVVSSRWRATAASIPDRRSPIVSFEEIADETGGRDWPTPSPEDGVLLITTSGSTGTPKGVLLSHANCHWTNESLAAVVDVRPSDGVLQILPQFHVGGWNVQPLLAWRRGARVLLEARFDPERALDLIDAGRVSTMMGVPTNYLLMSQSPRFDRVDLSSLREIVVGGAVMPIGLAARWAERGVRVYQGYGLSEASPNVCCLRPEDAAEHPGSVGRPYPHVEVALYDVLARTFVEGEGRGELCVRGPNVFAGYWRDPAATAGALVDGWLHSGDVAARDDEGFYRIVGRIKEIYVSGGENVYPAEVERVLGAHPGVLDAAVVAVADERWGEAGVAYLVVEDPSHFDTSTLRSFCRTSLATYKVPRDFHVVDALPRTPVGKLDRAALAQQAREL